MSYGTGTYGTTPYSGSSVQSAVGTLAATLPALSIDVEAVFDENILEVTLPPLDVQVVEEHVSGTLSLTLPMLAGVDLLITFPALSVAATGRSQHNQLINYLPLLSVDVEAHRRDSVLELEMPALSVSTTLNTVPVPDFETAMRSTHPDVWWRLDQADARELLLDSSGTQYLRHVDYSGHGFDARAGTYNGYGYVPGSVPSAAENIFEATTGNLDVRTIGEVYGAPSQLNATEFTAFAIAHYIPPDSGNVSWMREAFGRTGLWYAGIINGRWSVRYGLNSYPYYGEIGFPYLTSTSERVDTIALVVSLDETGQAYLQAYLNGAVNPNSPDPQQISAAAYMTMAQYANEGGQGLDVGYQGGWPGTVHAGYWKRALSAAEITTLHAAATGPSPAPNTADAFFAPLSAEVTATQPEVGALELDMPALSARGYVYTGTRSGGGGHSWQDATPITRGQLTVPSPRTDYAQVGADDPSVGPYYSAWWKWTGDGTEGTVWFSTLRSIPDAYGTQMDTVLAVYVENNGTLTQVAYNDDVSGYTLSQVVFSSTVPDQTYYIRCGTFDTSGDGVNAYVLDNDLVPPPTLADLMVIGGSQSPAGYIGTDGATSTTLPTLLSNSVSAPTVIAPGEQAWWRWVADYTGTVSFDALLSQNMITGGVGADGPDVGVDLWTDGQWLAYSDSHGTVDYQVNQGQITWDVTAGQEYHIKLSKGSNTVGNANVLIRVSQIAIGGIVTPGPRSFVVDATPLDRGQVASTLGVTDLHYVAEGSGGPITALADGARALTGFEGSYDLSRAFNGPEPQLSYNGALNCLWSQARTGQRGDQYWSKTLSGSDYGGSGTCASPWYATASRADSGQLNGAAGTWYHGKTNDTGAFYYADAIIDTWGSHYQVSITGAMHDLRARSDVRDDAALVAVSVMADAPVVNQQGYLTWYGNVTRPKGYSGWDAHMHTWGPDPGGGWWSSGVSDAEVSEWMAHPITHGVPPATAGGYYDSSGNWVAFTDPSQYWLPLDAGLLSAALSYEGDPTNVDSGIAPYGLTLAYLPPELALFDPPPQVYEAFGQLDAGSGLTTYAHRLLMKIDIQEPAYYGTANPLGADGQTFPRVGAYDASIPTFGPFPAPLDPGPIDSQILFGPYPMQFSPVIDVLVFGPRHKSIPWPAMSTTAKISAEVHTDVPTQPNDPQERPMGTVRFQMPEFTLVDGIPVASKATGRLTIDSSTVAPTLATKLFSFPQLVSLGEDVRFSPIESTSQTSTSTFRRYPNAPLEYRTTAEVTSLPCHDGSPVLSSPLPGPERVSSYAYWRGEPAVATAISFRSSDLGEESLIANAGDWITGPQFTVLLAAVLSEKDVIGPLSPLVVAADPTGQPRTGLFFNADSELLWWDYQEAVDDVTKRIRGSMQLLGDIRRVSQPVLIGARIDNTTSQVTLVAADTRLRTVQTSMVAPIPANHQLLVGDAGALTGPGAFDMLDMRWWRRTLSDQELLAAAAAMADLWGVLL